MKYILLKSILVLSLLLFGGCDSAKDSTSKDPSDSADATFEISDWTDATHSKNVDPNFTEVFSDTEVKRFDIVITSERWQSMLDNMQEIYGDFATSEAGNMNEQGTPPEMGTLPPGEEEGERTPPSEQEIGTLPPSEEGDNNQQAFNQTIDTLSSEEDPLFVPAEVFYKNKQWYKVGIRFKGNSSLKNSWETGILKLSLKLDFDEFEDTYPQIKNQRFYGFKKFSLKNNFNDNSFLREKMASDVFKNAGLAVSNTSFYKVYIDHGNGQEYFGLYTLVEEIDGSVLDTQFSSDKGNLYKPEDGSANFVENTFNKDNFEKKTNEDNADWSDIQALFTALHSETRISEPSTWRANLEEVFDVDVFLKYLAVNGIIQNWDTYGRMIHNYYLYNNPETGKLTWIPWDYNEAFQEGKSGGSLALDFSNLDTNNWPLIEKIYSDSTYKIKYDLYVQEIINGPYNASTAQAQYDTYSQLIQDAVNEERESYTFLNNANDFNTAISEIKEHAITRTTAANTYLGN